MTELLKSAVRYSFILGSRFSKWRLLSLSSPKARRMLLLLIPLFTWWAVNVTGDGNDFRLITLYTNRVS